ncbi:hypothetical protein SBOR_1729 [Sclerotinia borealis F-4128]|uniref:Uncharacterized protein n=1 Tax=Sclerotinia borealis (strain F-4128) TaxID=1432307 RepID=W9CPA3_SCLBF|nr:hypothetical protein SBOR_1729 [Sclerotinia borealis F-4128]
MDPQADHNQSKPGRDHQVQRDLHHNIPRLRRELQPQSQPIQVQKDWPQYPGRELQDLPFEQSTQSYTELFSQQHYPQADNNIDEKQLAELEEQIKQEYIQQNHQRHWYYARFCHYFAKRRIEQINLPDYHASLLKLRLQNQGVSQRSHPKSTDGPKVEDYFRRLEVFLTAKGPEKSQEVFSNTWNACHSPPYPIFPSGGPAYQNKVARLYQIDIECKLKFYTLLQGGLNVYKVFQQSNDHSDIVGWFHPHQERQHQFVTVETINEPFTFTIPDSFWPTFEGTQIEVNCFVETTSKIKYFFCFDPPVGLNEIPFWNPETRLKGLGSGSSSNGKETVRRRSMSPKKAARSLKKKNSSAKFGRGMDGSCSNEEVKKSSPSLSPRRDSGIESELASKDSIHTITPYDVEEDMVKPLNVESLSSDSGDTDVDTIGEVENVSGLEKEQEKKMDENLDHGLEAFLTPIKSKGEDVPFIDTDDANGEGSNDFSLSLIGLGCMMASNNKLFRVGKGKEERQVETPNRDSNDDAFVTNNLVGIKRMSPKDLPRLNTIGLVRDTCQQLASTGSENELERLLSREQGSEHESPDEYSHIGITQENFKTADLTGRDATSSPESECELERIFSLSREQISEPETLDEHLADEQISGIRSLDNFSDVSEENRRDASIQDFSFRVPYLVRKAGVSVSISPPRFCRSDAPSPSAEILGEVCSLKETEFCASGLKNTVVDEVGRSVTLGSSEESLDGSAQMEDACMFASLEGVSSNCGSAISWSVMRNIKADPFMVKDSEVGSCSDVSVDGLTGAGAEAEDQFDGIQVKVISSSQRRLRDTELDFPSIENYEALPIYDESIDSIEVEDDGDIVSSSERFSPITQGVLSSMTPKHSVPYAIKNNRIPPASYHASIYSSLRPEYVETFDGNSPEESLIGAEGCSEGESEEEMGYIEPQDFWMQACKGKMISKTEREVDTETEVETDEEERQYLLEMGRNMKKRNPGLLGPTVDEDGRVLMGISPARFDGAPRTIRRSIPQMDGPNSPPLLEVDSGPAERIWSPSPRKKLQKVNRSKSPNSMKKSSSSSLGRIFQNSKVEGMEGEIRDLRTEVEELKKMVDNLERELKVVKSIEENGCVAAEKMKRRMNEVWGAIYGKGWDGEKIGEVGEDWKDRDEVECTREVRDAGLLRVVGRMKREMNEKGEKFKESDEFWKERGIEPYEMDLMLPIPTEPESRRNKEKEKDEDPMRVDTSTPMEIPEEEVSKYVATSKGLETNDSLTSQYLEFEDAIISASSNLKPEEELSMWKKEKLDLRYQRKSLENDVRKFRYMVKEALGIELDVAGLGLSSGLGSSLGSRADGAVAVEVDGCEFEESDGGDGEKGREDWMLEEIAEVVEEAPVEISVEIQKDIGREVKEMLDDAEVVDLMVSSPLPPYPVQAIERNLSTFPQHPLTLQRSEDSSISYRGESEEIPVEVEKQVKKMLHNVWVQNVAKIKRFEELPDTDHSLGRYDPVVRMVLWNIIKRNFSREEIERMRWDVSKEGGSGKGRAIFGDSFEERKIREGTGDQQESTQLSEKLDEGCIPDKGPKYIEHLAYLSKAKRTNISRGNINRGMRPIEGCLGLVDMNGGEKIGSWKPGNAEMRELIETGAISAREIGGGKGKGKEMEGEMEKGKKVDSLQDEIAKGKAKEKAVEEAEEKKVEYLMRHVLGRQEVERARMEEWWEIERGRDLEEIRRLGREVEVLRGEVANLKMGVSGVGRGRGRTNMRKRDVCGDEDSGDSEDSGESGEEDGEGERDEENGYGGGGGNAYGNANKKGFWDWVGGGILWRQD